MTVYHTEHSVTVAAAPRSVYNLVADVTLWPAIFGPTVYVRHLQQTQSQERFQLWALVNDAVSNWTSRRVLDAEQLHIAFRQEVSSPPIASMSGEWHFRALPDDRTEVLLTHDFTPVSTSAEQVSRIQAALDRNSGAELAALARVAGLGIPADQVVFSFEDVVEVPGSAAEAYDFVYRGNLWPQRLPHVKRAELTEFPGNIQRLEMTTVTADGSCHDTRSYRIGAPGKWIAYKQEVTPALLTGHSGLWAFADHPAHSAGNALVTARHTVAVNPAAVATVLGPDRTLADARQYVRDALGANSKATLAHAAAHARSTR